MRVALVVHDCHQGGGHERYTAELLRRVAPVHETHLFACSYQDQGAPIAAFHRLRTWDRPPNLAKILLILAQTSRLREAGPFDVVHSQGLCFRTQNLTTAHVCQAARIPWLSTTGGSRNTYQRLYLRWSGQLERRYIYGRRDVRVLAVSRKVARELEAHYGCSPDRIRVVYPGVDPGLFRTPPGARDQLRRELGLAEDDRALLFVGTPFKGLATLLQALDPVAAGRKARLLVVGGGDPALYHRNIGPGRDWVRFLGYRRDLARLYAAADMFVFPSFYDTFGLVVLEAMAAGLPVLVSVEAGVHEIIADGVEGLHLRRPAEPEALRSDLLHALADEDLRHQLSRAGVARAETMTWDRTAAEVMETYATLARGPF